MRRVSRLMTHSPQGTHLPDAIQSASRSGHHLLRIEGKKEKGGKGAVLPPSLIRRPSQVSPLCYSSSSLVSCTRHTVASEGKFRCNGACLLQGAKFFTENRVTGLKRYTGSNEVPCHPAHSPIVSVGTQLDLLRASPQREKVVITTAVTTPAT